MCRWPSPAGPSSRARTAVRTSFASSTSTRASPVPATCSSRSGRRGSTRPTGRATRASTAPTPPNLPMRLGYEVSGVVSAVGPSVRWLSPGDEVIAWRVKGGYADRIVVSEQVTVRRPPNLDWPAAVRAAADRRHGGPHPQRDRHARRRRRARARRLGRRRPHGRPAGRPARRPGDRDGVPAAPRRPARPRCDPGGLRRRAARAGARGRPAHRRRSRSPSTPSAPTRRWTPPSPWSPTATASRRSPGSAAPASWASRRWAAGPARTRGPPSGRPRARSWRSWPPTGRWTSASRRPIPSRTSPRPTATGRRDTPPGSWSCVP